MVGSRQRSVGPTRTDPTYDDDGNMTTTGNGWTYTYDGENRLITAETTTTRETYSYDSQSRRFKKEVEQWDSQTSSFSLLTSTLYLYDGWNLIHEEVTHLQSQITNHKSFVWGLDLSGSLQGAGGVGGLLAMTDDSGLTVTYTYDGNGNVSTLYDLADGAVVARYEYDPFGNTISISESPTLPISNPFKFSTKYQDAGTGLCYYGLRYFYPLLGNWINRDPIEEIGGVNVYGFVRNRPISVIDSNGEADQQTVTAPYTRTTTSTTGTFTDNYSSVTITYTGTTTSGYGVSPSMYFGSSAIAGGLAAYGQYLEAERLQEDKQAAFDEYTRIMTSYKLHQKYNPGGKEKTTQNTNSCCKPSTKPRINGETRRIQDPKTCCTFIWTNDMKYGKYFGHQMAATLISGAPEEVVVETPEGRSKRFDGGMPQSIPETVIEVKTLHYWLPIPPQGIFQDSYISQYEYEQGRYHYMLYQFNSQAQVAQRCGLRYEIYATNKRAYAGFKKHYPEFIQFIQYRDLWYFDKMRKPNSTL